MKFKKHIEDICQVSDFIVPTSFHRDMAGSELKEYLERSARRRLIVQSKFEEINYRTKLHEFEYKEHIATNVVFGKKRTKNEIWLIGHHDYCAGLGAEDNATSLALLIEVAKYFKNSPIAEKLIFSSFDLEEVNMSGSIKFVREFQDDLKENIRYAISLECLGSGKDIVIATSVADTTSDPKLVDKLYKTAMELNYNFILEDANQFYTDHVPFARRGIKATEIMSYHPVKDASGKIISLGRRDGSIAHTSFDLPENINYSNLEKVYNTLVRFIEKEYR